jgi:hypothetical protein
MNFSKPGGFMLQAHVPGAQIVKIAGHDDSGMSLQPDLI